MNRFVKIAAPFFALCAPLLAAPLLIACSSAPKVSRVDADTQTDLSGYWNDTDVRIVCESLIKACLDSPRVTQETAKKGRLPVILVGTFKNDSDEHIDTSIISKTMEAAIFNSGKADFAAGGSVREELRAERLEQEQNASEETAAVLRNETGADFMLTGSVKAIVDRAGKTAVRTYFVSAELSNIETNTRLWMEQNSEIKKIIKRPGLKL
ncbi:MAG: penicillin-binding protein activator LpoB [Treponema sp.]|jgi:PBP1b-binding outer membrane lipoprotein LpoB|nr:penicillin-binding protein activator LpoB [Treponema sp.]